MIEARLFKDEILALIDDLYDSQNGNIDKMAEVVAECIASDGVVHVFGSGHSVGLGIDITGRLGSLIPIHIMEMNHFVTMGGVSLEDYQNKDDIFERRPGVAKKLYDLYDIRPQDVFIVISNSGINGIVIDIAALAKENGHKVIIVTSMNHTLVEDSRHPSGKKLYMFGDVVVDNCGPHGDALLETDGVAKVCSVSSICNNLIAQSMAAKVIEILAKKDIDVPIISEDKEKNEAFFKKYEGRI